MSQITISNIRNCSPKYDLHKSPGDKAQIHLNSTNILNIPKRLRNDAEGGVNWLSPKGLAKFEVFHFLIKI